MSASGVTTSNQHLDLVDSAEDYQGDRLPVASAMTICVLLGVTLWGLLFMGGKALASAIFGV
jgi:hypothetical protein